MIAEPAYPDDDGTVDPAVAAALSAYAEDGALAEVLVALAGARVVVPVVAVRGEDAVTTDKEADMAAVLLTGADGRTALLAFSGLQPLQHWDAGARPVPVTVTAAAAAAVAEGAAAIVLDVAGPVRLVIDGEDLAHLARGEQLLRVADGYGWAVRDGSTDGS